MVRREPLDTTVEIETPEHVRFNFHLAGPARRSMAYLIDLMIRAGVMFVVMIIVMLTVADDAFEEAGNASTGVLMLALFAIDWGYYVLFETIWSGRSPGKRSMNIRVVREGGHSLHLVDSMLRNLLRAADFLPMGYALGLAVMGRDAKFRRLGDLVAGTVVIVEERSHIGGPLKIFPPASQQEIDWLPARPPLANDELEAIELFLRRRGALAPAREHELASIVAPTLAKRMGLRYQDPVRFLALLFHKVRNKGVVAAPAGPGQPSPRSNDDYPELGPIEEDSSGDPGYGVPWGKGSGGPHA
jgi:uncharacterized RDD family membrane protein YckC